MESVEIYKDWVESAFEDFSVAQINFNAEKYKHCVVNCHHALEKMVKAIYINYNGKLPRKSHNIVELLREVLGDIVYTQLVSEEKQDFFADVTSFYPGINYPDSNRYNKIERELAEKVLLKTRSELEWLKYLLK